MPIFKQLLMIWAAAGNVLDWSLLEGTWKVPVWTGRSSEVVSRGEGPQKLKRLKKLVNEALASRGLLATRLTISRSHPCDGRAGQEAAEALGLMPRHVLAMC